MNTAFRLFKNSFALSVAVGVERIVSFVLPLYIARSIGVSGLGFYATINSLWLIFESLAYLGLDQVLMRDVAREPKQAPMLLMNAGVVGLFSSLVFGVAMVGVAYLLNYPAVVIQSIYIVAGFVLVFDTLSTIAESIVKGLERMEFVLFVRFPANLLRVVLSVFALSRGAGLASVFWVSGFFQIALLLGFSWLILSWHNEAGSLRAHVRFSWPLCRRLTRTTLVFLGISLFAAVFGNVNVILLSKLQNERAVGIYDAASKIVQMGKMLSPALMLALYPTLARAFANSETQLGRLVVQFLKLLLILLLPVVLFVWVFAKDIILLFYKDSFAEAVILLRVLIWILPPFFANNLLFRAMLASNNEKITLRIAGTNAVINLILDIILIPTLGALGTSIAAVITTVVAFIQNYYYLNRRVCPLNLSRVIILPMCSVGLAFGVYMALSRINVFIALAGAFVVYAGFLVLSRTLSYTEWRYAVQIWQRISSHNL
ncbi:MAG TPA: oligosaccharide flippase family protein [Anaerolineae bacterium]|nr:oligosaccharide flippase family protein [Anaerolineae bacterium]HQI85497.1 oligosaccharide flippase family protein [Anaerolineae bacterium]